MSARFPKTGGGSWVADAPAINAEAPDRLLTCPNCGDLWPEGYTHCLNAHGGLKYRVRLLPTEHELPRGGR